MSTIKDGGPAFPRSATKGTSGTIVREAQDGMTLRDWFAGQTLTGLLLGPGQLGEAAQGDPAKAAEWAYQQADAMLARRNKQ